MTSMYSHENHDKNTVIEQEMVDGLSDLHSFFYCLIHLSKGIARPIDLVNLISFFTSYTLTHFRIGIYRFT